MPLYLRLLVALAAGLLAALGFAPYDLWPLTIVATAALVGLIEAAPTRRHAAAAGWLWGFGMFVASLTWIATAFTFQAAMPVWVGWVAVVGLSMFLALYVMLAALAARLLAPVGVARLMVFAGAFMAAEWLRGWLLTGFAWNPLGAAWLPAPGVVQLAQFFGAQGLSGVMVLAGGALWLMFAGHRSNRERLVGAGLAGLVVLGGGAGATLEQDVYLPENPELVIVQPDIGQDVKYDPGANARHLETYLALTRAALGETVVEGVQARGGVLAGEVDPVTGLRRPVEANSDAANVEARAPVEGVAAEAPLSEQLARQRAVSGTGGRPRLVIWSESSVFGLPEEDPGLRAKLASALGPDDYLMFGGVGANRDADGRMVSLRNSLFVLDAAGVIRAQYAKAHLTPLGEYVPARELMERLGLARLAPGDIDFVPGPGPQTFALPGIPPFGAMICYEIIFGGRVTEYGQRPAWIVNVSNDAWFGPTGPPQHLAQARLRAIEEGLPIARATPTGISAVIGPRGQVYGTIAQGQASTLTLTLPPPLPATLYARSGDALPTALALALMLGGALIGLLMGKPTAPGRGAESISAGT